MTNDACRCDLGAGREGASPVMTKAPPSICRGGGSPRGRGAVGTASMALTSSTRARSAPGEMGGGVDCVVCGGVWDTAAPDPNRSRRTKERVKLCETKIR